MEDQLVQIGNRIRKARKAKNMTQAQLADAAKVSVVFLSNIESGKQDMTTKTLIAISDALQVSTDWILRNETREANQITTGEISAELAECSAEERVMILKFVQEMKDSFRKIRSSRADE